MATVTLQVNVGGQLQSLPFGGTQTVGTEAISGTGTFTCEGEVLTTTYEGVTATFDLITEISDADSAEAQPEE